MTGIAGAGIGCVQCGELRSGLMTGIAGELRAEVGCMQCGELRSRLMSGIAGELRELELGTCSVVSCVVG